MYITNILLDKMNLSEALDNYLAERLQRVQAGQNLRRINDFDYRVFNAPINNGTLTDYMWSMENMNSPEAIKLKARVYVLWVYTLGNSGRRQEKFWSSIDWYEWWCQSRYMPNRDQKYGILRQLHTQINDWIRQIQPSFTLQLSQPPFFAPPIPELFFTFKWIFPNLDISRSGTTIYVNLFFRIDEILHRRATLHTHEKVDYAENIETFFIELQGLDEDTHLHNIDPLDLEEEEKISDLKYDEGGGLGYKGVYFDEGRIKLHKDVQLCVHKWIPAFFKQFLLELSRSTNENALKKLARLEVCRSYSIDQFACFVTHSQYYTDWEYFRGLDSNTTYWYMYYNNFRRKTNARPTPLGRLGPAIQELQAQCHQLLQQFNGSNHLEWNHEPTYEYWSTREVLKVYQPTGSGLKFVVPKTKNPRNVTRDLWLRLQKQKLEGSADVQEIDRKMRDLEEYRRRQNRQPSQPSAANAEAESSSEDEMPDVPPPKRLRTKLRF